MLSERRCPNCQRPLVVEKRWLGLVRRLPRECTACGARLAYDTAGGVHLLAAVATDAAKAALPRRER